MNQPAPTTDTPGPTEPSAHKRDVRNHADEMADARDGWIERNRAYYADDQRYMRFLIPEGSRVIELGSGTGQLLAALKPSRGVGVDISPKMVARAQQNHPDLHFVEADIEDATALADLGETFDAVIVSDTVGWMEDIAAGFEAMQTLCNPDTRIVIAYYSKLWEPLLKVGGALGLRMPQGRRLNWLGTGDIENMLEAADYDVIKREWRQLVPRNMFGIGRLINRFIAPLPIIRRFCLRYYLVARSRRAQQPTPKSVTVVVPARNERGNVEPLVQRLPEFGTSLEIMFVEGNSSDGTAAEVERVIAAYPDRNIRLLHQEGRGKADAVWKGFDNASGDILMILDADMTVIPEEMPKFYNMITSGKAEFVNGSRLVYPMEPEAMRLLNFLANRTFSRIFSYLLNERFTDTLCGTKVLSRENYARLRDGRSYFGDFDPFGDYDLIFGAAKLNLKISEVPVRYAARLYGETQISRFRDGWQLLRMVVFAFRKLKAL
ncbi:MAG: glycosyltransferase [Alphaproteobacteria bacterium]